MLKDLDITSNLCVGFKGFFPKLVSFIDPYTIINKTYNHDNRIGKVSSFQLQNLRAKAINRALESYVRINATSIISIFLTLAKVEEAIEAKQAIVVYGATIIRLPSQIATGGWVEKCHVIVLWWPYYGYLTTL